MASVKWCVSVGGRGGRENSRGGRWLFELSFTVNGSSPVSRGGLRFAVCFCVHFFFVQLTF